MSRADGIVSSIMPYKVESGVSSHKYEAKGKDIALQMAVEYLTKIKANNGIVYRYNIKKAPIKIGEIRRYGTHWFLIYSNGNKYSIC